MNLVAGVDGGLYAYGAAQQNSPGLQVRYDMHTLSDRVHVYTMAVLQQHMQLQVF
jgi:hypothetical protein